MQTPNSDISKVETYQNLTERTDSAGASALGAISGPFHRIGLSFGSAGAIVRLTSDDKIMSVAAAWVRIRKGDTDKVFLTTPEQLLGAPEDLVRCIILQGAAQLPRFDVVIRPEVNICNLLEISTPGGSYAAVYMDRIGQSPERQSVMRRLTATWRLDPRRAETLDSLSNYLHEDFLDHARDVPSAWPIMYASAALFGGQDPAEMPPSPPELPAVLAEACADEQRFRANRRRALALSPDKRAEFMSKLSGQQAAAFKALLEGRRTHS